MTENHWVFRKPRAVAALLILLAPSVEPGSRLPSPTRSRAAEDRGTSEVAAANVAKSGIFEWPIKRTYSRHWVSLMKPLLVGEDSRHRGVFTDLALDLAQKSARFRGSLPESLLASLADLMRAMNGFSPSGHTNPSWVSRESRLLWNLP